MCVYICVRECVSSIRECVSGTEGCTSGVVDPLPLGPRNRYWNIFSLEYPYSDKSMRNSGQGVHLPHNLSLISVSRSR